jgi:UDP-2,4-diacetamido-2,4,6-trideoxy-beta-L-altropyranose hydrolase
MAHLKHYYADIVLNQNLHAEKLHYSCEPYTRFLIGTKYVLLRREFRAWRGKKRQVSEKVRHVLVTLGGADPKNHTLKVVRALQQINLLDLEATVVIGGSNINADSLQAETLQGGVPVRLVRDAKNMPELMAWADIAITGGGSTCWEIAFLGVPSLILVLADNQAGIARELDAVGTAQSLGRSEALDPDNIRQALSQLIKSPKIRGDMSRLGQTLVDGRGCIRVLKILEK